MSIYHINVRLLKMFMRSELTAVHHSSQRMAPCTTASVSLSSSFLMRPLEQCQRTLRWVSISLYFYQFSKLITQCERDKGHYFFLNGKISWRIFYAAWNQDKWKRKHGEQFLVKILNNPLIMPLKLICIKSAEYFPPIILLIVFQNSKRYHHYILCLTNRPKLKIFNQN